jgi:hypothetical protein
MLPHQKVSHISAIEHGDNETIHNADIALALEVNADVTDTSCSPVIIFVLINNGGEK